MALLLRPARRASAFALAALVLALTGGCRRGARDPLVTYYNPEYNLRVRYPASWKTEQAEQDGMWYRYFLGPPTGPQRKPAVSVTMFAGPLGNSLDEYAQRYVADATVQDQKIEDRQGLPAKRWQFTSADGATRSTLLLVEQKAPPAAASPDDGAPSAWVYGLYAQGEMAAFAEHEPTIDGMFESLAVDRPASWEEYRNEALGYRLRVPGVWREARHFSGGGKLLQQWTSPPLGADKGETLHASLTLSTEPTPLDIDAYWKAQRDAQGDSFALLSHTEWNGGYLDSLRSETPMATSRVKRYYRVKNGRAYVLALDAREDVFPRVSRWADQIASTLTLGAGQEGP